MPEFAAGFTRDRRVSKTGQVDLPRAERNEGVNENRGSLTRQSRRGIRMLEIEGVESGYGNLQILNGIDMSVSEGSIVALLGGNGTGKSTLLKAISGLNPVWKGEIRFEGQRIDQLRPHQIVRAGLVQVTQGKDSYPGMSVEENLMLGAFSRKDRSAVASDLDRVYAFFPVLKDKRKQVAGLLSGGQVQMLVIGRGLMAAPKLIMLDEPSAALAPLVVLDIFRQINRIRQEMGMTILIVEQNVRMALLLASYGYVIHDGRIQVQGEASDMIGDDKVRHAYLGGTVAEAAMPHAGGST